MPAAPFLSPGTFGDGDHEEGETGLAVSGQELGGGVAPELGTLRMYANADRTGAVDVLTYSSHNNNGIAGIAMPASPNNNPGTVYLVWERYGDGAFSNALAFTLSAVGGGMPADPQALMGIQTGISIGM